MTLMIYKFIFQVSVVIPKNNFRLFFTMDPRHGELSPAMRNRGVEIFLEKPLMTSNDSILSSKECSNISENRLQINKFAYHSNAYIASRRYELMERLITVSKFKSYPTQNLTQ